MPTIEQQDANIRDAKFDFFGLQPLSNESIATWESITEEHIIEYLNTISTTLLNSVDEVVVTHIDDSVISGDTRNLFLRSPNENTRRKLDVENILLQIICVIDVKYRTTVKTFDMHGSVSDAFRTASAKFEYTSSLQSVSPEIFGLAEFTTASIPPKSTTPKTSPDDDTVDDNYEEEDDDVKSESSNDDVTIITISVSIGTGVLIISMLAVWARQKRKLSMEGEQILLALDEEVLIDDDDTASVEEAVVARILTVGKRSENDSISALDDPTVFQAGNVSKSFDNRDDWTIANNTLGDESLVQVPTDGAYARIYGQSSRSISSTGSSDANATRDDTLMSKDIKSHNENIGQQRIEIDAPSGKLGIVIDSPGLNQAPMVHAIKETSVLSDILHVGDRIVAFNGEDTRTLTPIMLTKKISATFDMEDRRFVILRDAPTSSFDNPDRTKGNQGFEGNAMSRVYGDDSSLFSASDNSKDFSLF